MAMSYKANILALILLLGVMSSAFFILPDVSITGASIGLELEPDTVKDAYLKEGDKKKNYGVSEELDLKRNDRNIVLDFDISSLTANSTIHSAAMKLYATDVSKDDKTAETPVYRITRSWDEGTGNDDRTDDGVTWKWYTNNDEWNDSGGDYDIFEWSSTDVLDQDQWYEWDITELVKSWYNGTHNNYGLLLLTQSNNVGRKTFASSENSNISLRPQLVVNYSTPPEISNVDATEITLTTADIIWDTDDATNSTVNYGLTTALGTLATVSELVTTHNITISNLDDNETTYYYQVKSCNSPQLCTESSIYNFQTVINVEDPDMTSPNVTINSPENLTYNTQSIDINYTAADNLDIESCWYTIGNTNVTTGNCENWDTIVGVDQHTLSVYVSDTSQNIGSSSVVFTVNLEEASSGVSSSSSSSSGSGGGSSPGIEAFRELITETASEETEIIVANEEESSETQDTNANFFTGGVPLNIPADPETAGTIVTILLISFAAFIGYIRPSWLK